MPARMMPSVQTEKMLNCELRTCPGEKGVAGLPWFLDNCFLPPNAPACLPLWPLKQLWLLLIRPSPSTGGVEAPAAPPLMLRVQPPVQSNRFEVLQAEDEIMDLRILKTESLRNTKPADQCCLLRLYLRLYLGTVFKNYQPLDQHILRNVSSLANSFLTIKKDLRLCHARMTCPCGEEAMEKFNQILSRFKEQEPDTSKQRTSSIDSSPEMGSPMQKTALPCLSLILLIWSQGPGAQGQEFQFGPCRVEGVVFQELWEASRAVKDIVQAQDNIMSVRLLRREVLQNVSGAESCYLLRALLNFYLNTVFRNYHKKAAELRILKSFSTLANNFIVILSKLQPSQENEMFPIRESARRRFLLFQAAFKQLDIEAAQTKAFGEVDILLTWMQKFYQL
ncbi:Interleukin-24 [Myotis davidii]|uniref:Interleukin family protein n=2 Tax=Myotis davidii TaxID=225400 RepID=L5MF13_MYODS|nr:Interleukin-24 [Myotis davidii]